jgi:hypothetical protein
MAMAPKREAALVEENRHLNAENDALRAAIVKLRDKLDDSEMIRQEQAGYIRGLWEDNRRVHAELRFHNQQKEQNADLRSVQK